MRTRIIALGCLVVFVILIVVIGGIVLFLGSIPPVSQQVPPDSAPLLVNLTAPLNSSDVPLDSPTSIQASALGNSSILSLELWVDGNLAETKAAPRTDLKQFDAFWSWQPDSPGEHTLVARATDAARHIVSSNVVRINATADQDGSVTVNYQVKPGDTLASIAQESDATIGQISAVNSQMNTNNPIAAGQTISVPIKSNKAKSAPPSITATLTLTPAATATPQATPQTTTPAGSGAASDPFAAVKFWGKKNFAADALLPVAPLLAASSNGCAAFLNFTNVADNADSIFIYRTGAGNPQFTRIGTMGAPPKDQAWSYTDDKVAGLLEYYISAVNTLGESASKIVSVDITDADCGLKYNYHPIFKDGQIVPTEPLEDVYCYLAMNSGAWSRLPPAPGTFLPLTNGGFDLTAYLKTLGAGVTSQETMDLDCWGWRGGLTHLGEAKQTFTPQSNAGVQLVGDKFKFVGALDQLPNLKPFDPITFIYAPTGLRTTGNPSECTSYGGFLLAWGCEGAILNHWPVLIWDWQSGLAPNGQQVIADIDGYRVYENDIYFQHMLVTSSSSGPGNKVGLFPLPVIPPVKRVSYIAAVSESLNLNRCFVARAYKGATESGDSNTFCLGALPGTQTVVLNATTKTVWNIYTNQCAPADPNKVWGGQLVAGYWFEDLTRDLTLGCGDHLNIVLRTLARFDLTKIGLVSRATLRYKLFPGTTYGDNEDGHDRNRLQIPASFYSDRSCAVELMLATQDWASGTNDNTRDSLVPAEDYIELPTDGSDFAVDVTSAVAHWHSFGGNFGFELRGANEDTGSEENSECHSELGNFTLEVTFFPSSAPSPNLAPPALNPGQP